MRNTIVSIVVLLGSLFSLPVLAAYLQSGYPQFGGDLSLGYVSGRDRIFGLGTTTEWKMSRLAVAKMKFDYVPYPDTALTLYIKDKLNTGKSREVDEAYGFGARFKYEFWDWQDRFGADARLSVLAAYDYQKWRILGQVGSNNIYTNKGSTPYFGLRYDYHVQRWILGLEGDGTGWSQVNTRMIASANNLDQRGRFRGVKDYRFAGSIGYEFFPAWKVYLEYAAQTVRQAKGRLSTFLGGPLLSVQEGYRFKREQHTLSLGLAGVF